MNRTWLGVGVVVILAVALALVLSSGDETPATTTGAPTAAATTPTTPPSTTPPSTTPPSTTEAPTTTSVPPTTLDPVARAAEIEALVTDLEFALWAADYALDGAALADVIGGEALWERWTSAEDPRSFYSEQPSRNTFSLSLGQVLRDTQDCVVASVTEDPTSFLISGVVEDLIIVLWRADDARLGWRIAERWSGGTPDSEWGRTCNVTDRSWRP